MSLSFIAFIVSGAGIVVIIALKELQERMGILLFWPDIRARIESALQTGAAKVENYARTFNKRTLYIVLHYVLVKVKSLFVRIERLIDKRLAHLVNLIKGKHIRTDIKGSASHFLHDIHKFKEKFRRY